MSFVFSCLAYNDINSTIRTDGRVVFLALAQIEFADLQDEQNFGELAIYIEQDNLIAA